MRLSLSYIDDHGRHTDRNLDCRKFMIFAAQVLFVSGVGSHDDLDVAANSSKQAPSLDMQMRTFHFARCDRRNISLLRVLLITHQSIIHVEDGQQPAVWSSVSVLRYDLRVLLYDQDTSPPSKRSLCTVTAGWQLSTVLWRRWRSCRAPRNTGVKMTASSRLMPKAAIRKSHQPPHPERI